MNNVNPMDGAEKILADQVLAGLRNVCPGRVKGAHDSDFLILDGMWGGGGRSTP